MRFLLLFLFLILPTVGQDQEVPKPLRANPSQDLYDLATLYYNEAKGKKQAADRQEAYRLAATKFDRLLRAFPRNQKALESWYFLALCYRELGEHKASRECFETVATRWNDGPIVSAAAHHLAADDYDKERWMAAAKWFRILAKTTDKKKIRHEALYKRFVCFHKLKNDALTIPALNAILDDPGSPYHETARLTLARLYQQKNRNREAYQHFTELTNSAKADVRADAILQSALIAQKGKDRKAAKSWFRKSLADPGSKAWRAQSQVALMNLHYQDKEWQAVIDTYRKGQFKLDQKTNLQRLVMAAKSYEALGKTAELSKLEAQISQLSPDTMTGYQASYRDLVRSHQAKASDFPRKAEAFLKRYGVEQKLDPKTHSARLLLAEHYYRKKNFRAALSHYQELRLKLIDESNRLGARYHLAKSAIALGLKTESLNAIAAFFRGHPNAPQETSLLLERAEIYFTQGQHDAAVRDYETVLAKTKDQKLRLNLLKRLSSLYQEQKNYDSLVALQKKLLAMPQLDAETKASANFWLGWNQYRLKNHAETTPYLLKARELAPKTFTTQVGPILIRCAFQAEDLELLQKEIALLRRQDPRAPLPSAITTWLGATLTQAGKYDEGHRFLQEGIKTSKQEIQPVVWRLFAQASLENNQPEDALKAADQVLKVEKDPYRKAETLYLKARALTALKKFEKARRATADALDLRPQGELNTNLRLQAGDIEMAAKEAGEALRHYLIVESLYAKTPEKRTEAARKVIACLKAIGTPDALKKIPEFEAKLK